MPNQTFFKHQFRFRVLAPQCYQVRYSTYTTVYTRTITDMELIQDTLFNPEPSQHSLRRLRNYCVAGKSLRKTNATH